MSRLSRWGGGHSRQRGQALVEFALIATLLVLLIVAVFDAGRAVFVYNSITNGAREGARFAIVNQDQASIRTRAAQQSAGVVTSTAVTVEYVDDSSGLPCDGVGPDPKLAIGCSARVSINATWRAVTPLIGNVIGPLTLTTTSSLPIEFVCGVPSAPITDPLSCPKQP